jgi:hypothetical protein
MINPPLHVKGVFLSGNSPHLPCRQHHLIIVQLFCLQGTLGLLQFTFQTGRFTLRPAYLTLQLTRFTLKPSQLKREMLCFKRKSGRFTFKMPWLKSERE